MKIFWTTTLEMAKTNPEIFCHNLKSEGFYIGCPGTIIFRSRQEAMDTIDKVKAMAVEKGVEQ